MTTVDPNALSRPQGDTAQQFYPNLATRYRYDQIFAIASWVATCVGIVVLLLLLYSILHDGLPRFFSSPGEGAPARFSLDFVTSFPSRRAERAGALSALVGTIWLLVITASFAFPIGVGTGIYLQEFAGDSWFARMVEINISNLAAVPSIIYGLLGLMVFVRILQPITGGRSVLAGGLTLALLILPVIIVATRESLKAVPDSLRMAGMALGATRWQTVWNHILPQAFPGVLTGTILGLSRAIGETAPLIVIGAQTFVPFVPTGLQSAFSALPIQIFNWTSRPQEAFHANAAAGGMLLLIVLLTMNASAIYLRNRFQSRR